MRRVLCLVLAGLPLLGATAAWAAQRTLAVVDRPTEIKAFAGTAVFSQWDGASYRLAAVVGLGAPSVLNVPPQATPFDADIGPDVRGRPSVVVSRCDRGEDCALWVLRLDGSSPRRLQRTDDPRLDEIRPTIHGDRVAFVRRDARRPKVRDRILTRTLSSPQTTVSTVLRRLGPEAQVDELELGRTHVAATTSDFATGGGGICGQRDVSVVALGTGRVRTLDGGLCGLDGQSWAGPTFGGPWLYVARYCAAGGCRRGFGALRYRLDGSQAEIATFARNLTGWAYDGNGRAYEVVDRTQECGRDLSGPPCSVVRTSGLVFLPRD